MELCQQLRRLFIKDDLQAIEITDLRYLINESLNKQYSKNQVIIGMDYAGFKRKNDSYFVKVNTK
jgi:hypothetical protein